MTVAGKQTSHHQILKSTGIVGGAQVVAILIRVIRSKVIAVLLGPMGVGLAGMYQATISLVRSATSFGLNFSAVRDIGEAAGSCDEHRISRTILILRRWVWFTGLLGMTVAIVFSQALSRYAFGTEERAWGIVILSVCILLTALTEGQLALLQGLRRVGSMAIANIGGVAAGFCVSVPLYWFMGIKGIVPAMLLTAAASLLLSWCFARHVPTKVLRVSLKDTFIGGLSMVRLGIFMVIANFMMTAVMYFVRGYISTRGGLEAVGQFQAAWTLSSLYLATILQAMGADYFPRLSAISNDNKQIVRLANEQTEVALLVAGPSIVVMLSFISILVYALFSSKFVGTVGVLQWQLAGAFLKVLSWPIGFIMLAKRRTGLFMGTELCWDAAYVGLIIWGWKSWGLEMTGIAFLVAFFIYLGLIAGVGRGICGFVWSKGNLKHILVLGIAILLAFLNLRYMRGAKGYISGGMLSFATMVYSFCETRKLVDLKRVIRSILRR